MTRISEARKQALLTARGNMYRDDVTPPIEKIAGMFPRGYISTVASMPGAGKTWLMQYIACQLSVGGKILGGMVAKSPKYKCVIFAGETGKTLLDQRLAQTNWEHDPDRMIIYEAITWAKNRIPYMINTVEGQATISDVVEIERPAIVWFDTFISFCSADESKQEVMNMVYQYLLRLASEYNIAVVLNNHTRKKPSARKGEGKATYTQDDVIGSSAGIRLAHSIFIISVDALDEGKSLQTVTNVKSWDAKIPPFTYQFTTDNDGYLDIAVGFDTAGKNIFWSIRERITEYVRSMNTGAYITVADVAKFLDVSQDNVRTCLEYLNEGNRFSCKSKLLERTTLMGKVAYRVL